jgi:hypothetical protein
MYVAVEARCQGHGILSRRGNVGANGHDTTMRWDTMRRASKRDRNEGSIRKRAEALGFLWLENNASTKGRPDACLLRNGRTYWCEVKVPGEPYTPAQMEAFPRLIAKGVPVYVLTTLDDVRRLAAGTLRAWSPERVEKVWSPAGGRMNRAHRPGHSRAERVVDLCATDCCPRSRLPGLTMCAMCAGKGKK